MHYSYKVSTGDLYKGPELIERGYSGHGEGRNNTDMEEVHNVGPIPRGWYKIIRPAYDDPHGLGPCVMHLEPMPGTMTYGRDLFRLHGDSKTHDASHGCIVMGHDTRKRVNEDTETDQLEVY